MSLHLYKVAYSYQAKNRYRTHSTKNVAADGIESAIRVCREKTDIEDMKIWSVNHLGRIDFVDEEANNE